jgi:hypothetical protein
MQQARALMLMEDELFPRPQFSDRMLSKTTGGFSARLLSAVGQDSVEVSVNSQTEKRLFSALGVSAQGGWALSEKFRMTAAISALRASAMTQFTESTSWKKDEAQSEIVGKGHVFLLIKEGISVGAGAVYVLRPNALESFEFAGQSAVKKYARYSLWIPEFAAKKDAGSWSAGVGWRPRTTQSRTFTREGSGETAEIQEDVVLDELWSAGVAVQLSNNRLLSLDVNLHGARSSSAGTNATVDGSTSTSASENDGRRRSEVSILYGFSEWAGHRLSLGAGYQSIAYSEQANVNPQSIPLWSVLIRDEFKRSELNIFIDGLFGFGSDLQSLPDLNAQYRRAIVSVQTGVRF